MNDYHNVEKASGNEHWTNEGFKLATFFVVQSGELYLKC